MQPTNRKEIAKNVLFLYVRMIFIMGVGLYASRAILSALGDSDFGVYNVIAGTVLMFAFFSSSLSNATQRFLSIALGEGNLKKVRQVFVLNLTTFFILSLLVVLVAEGLGLWLLHNKLVLPPERMSAALWVFHSAVVSLFFSVNGIVFNAVLVSREAFKVYAYIGILEALLKLAIALCLPIIEQDKLVVYALLYMGVTISIQIFYALYCRVNFPECCFSFHWSVGEQRKLLAFVGWNGISTFAGTISGSGLNLVLNMLWGGVVNAARALSAQIEYALGSVNNGFLTAVKPQIFKLYAQRDQEGLNELVCTASKYSFCLMFALGLPILVFRHALLDLWLQEVPDFTSQLLFWGIIFILIDCLRYPIWILAQAVGELKKYILWESFWIVLAIPVGYFISRIWFVPEVFIVALVLMRFCAFLSNLGGVFSQVQDLRGDYLKRVPWSIAKVVLVGGGYSYLISQMFDSKREWMMIGGGMLHLFGIILVVMFLGIERRERKALISRVRDRFSSIA